MSLRLLLERGDVVEIRGGQLVITPRSGKKVPDEWLRDMGERLVREVSAATGIPTYRYLRYSTGLFLERYSGVALQFINVVTGEGAHAVFNADLKRKRNTTHGKAGSALPKGQFWAGERSEFYKFWFRTGLRLPRRFGVWHDYMGNLKQLYFTGNAVDERIDKSSLQPLCVSYEQLVEVCSPHKTRTIDRQEPDNIQTKVPDNSSPESLAAQGMQQNQSTGCLNRENKVISINGYRGTLPGAKKPEEQSHSEWLADYFGEV